MARISIKPVEPLELEFANGTIKRALFNNEAYILFTEEFGDISKLTTEKEFKKNPYDLMSKILYCGLKIVHPETTLEEAEQILYRGGIQLLTEIAECTMANFQVLSNEETKKKLKSMLTKTMTKQQVEILKAMKWV